MEKLNWTRKEFMEVNGISSPTAKRWIDTPGFPVIRLGKKILIPIEPFKKWLAAQVGDRD